MRGRKISEFLKRAQKFENRRNYDLEASNEGQIPPDINDRLHMLPDMTEQNAGLVTWSGRTGHSSPSICRSGQGAKTAVHAHI